jgi:hypothetical protein
MVNLLVAGVAHHPIVFVVVVVIAACLLVIAAADVFVGWAERDDADRVDVARFRDDVPDPASGRRSSRW